MQVGPALLKQPDPVVQPQVVRSDMSQPSTPSSFEASPFAHLETMVSALGKATDATERRMYIRGIARALEFIVGKTHAALVGLVVALAKEGK